MVARPFLAMAAGWWWRRLSLWDWGWGGGCRDRGIARGLTVGGGLAALLRSLACLIEDPAAACGVVVAPLELVGLGFGDEERESK
jgi:hypothetical protein